VERILPAVQGYARVKFHRLRGYNKEEAIADAVACAFELYVAALARGKAPAEFVGAFPVFAVQRVRSGRGSGRQNSTDVMELRAQRKHGYDREPLDDYPGARASVPEEVASRLDFAAWLDGLNPACRRVAETLGRGLTAAETAAELGCSVNNVQHLRDQCRKDWRRCQAEA
jgi:hypothetical protein